jgi:hypothetical protein
VRATYNALVFLRQAIPGRPCPGRQPSARRPDDDIPERGPDGPAAGVHHGMTTQAILFDSDGVLVDTERLYFDATCAAFRTV